MRRRRLADPGCSILTQSRLPRLWSVFQYLFGGTVDKRRLALQKFKGYGRVLEVGCSTGNIAAAFQDQKCDYWGVDIDPSVIAYAQRAFLEYPRMRFVCDDLLKMVVPAELFDYILFSGVCHHVEEGLLRRMLAHAKALLASEGILVVIDPILPESGSWLVRHFHRIDHGEFLRTERELLQVLRDIPGLVVCHTAWEAVAATPFSWPVVAHFSVTVLCCGKKGDDPPRTERSGARET